ncbi:hypothetical protein PGTUg99_019097 [Puccinia graminis f. sp. tritici]|uniref:Uncharacterized protein n=1 Tax=Puccinia graminis f. sp. tritici TaxID=56615 RepID=A0A5B0RYW5_PUCGR|nr:hypothetical protein PGTUg99_019097 [Puccinia graminis f. sp. tritici]
MSPQSNIVADKAVKYKQPSSAKSNSSSKGLKTSKGSRLANQKTISPEFVPSKGDRSSDSKTKLDKAGV